MQVKFKKLHPNATIPKKAHASDAGFDLTAVAITSKETDDYVEFDTGIAVAIPENHVGLVFPRSSVSKTNYLLANSTGIIDSNYRGPIKLRFRQIQALPIEMSGYSVGDRIGQLIIMPYSEIQFEVVAELDESERGTGGFGSTNLN